MGASNLEQEDCVVKCDICGQELANSEEVKAHKEQEHPMGEDGKTPEMGEEIKRQEGEMPASEMPEPAEHRNR